MELTLVVIATHAKSTLRKALGHVRSSHDDQSVGCMHSMSEFKTQHTLHDSACLPPPEA